MSNPFKNVIPPNPKQKIFRAKFDVVQIKCANCGSNVFKQHGAQIVYFCSKACRKELRNGNKGKKSPFVSKARIV